MAAGARAMWAVEARHDAEQEAAAWWWPAECLGLVGPTRTGTEQLAGQGDGDSDGWERAAEADGGVRGPGGDSRGGSGGGWFGVTCTLVRGEGCGGGRCIEAQDCGGGEGDSDQGGSDAAAAGVVE